MLFIFLLGTPSSSNAPSLADTHFSVYHCKYEGQHSCSIRSNPCLGLRAVELLDYLDAHELCAAIRRIWISHAACRHWTLEPRGIEFDTAGHLLVVEQGNGDLTALTLQDGGAVSQSVTRTP